VVLLLDLGARPSWCRSVSDPVFSVVDLGPQAVLHLTRWISATVTLSHQHVLVFLLSLLAAAINLLRVLASWILVLRYP
jgi:hypothetical protein